MKKKTIFILMIVVLAAAACAGCAVHNSDAVGAELYQYDFDKYIQLPEYMGLDGGTYSYDITDADVQKEIQAQLKKHADKTLMPTGIVQDGDTVNVDFVGTINGKEFEGGSAQDFDVEIGSGSLVGNFEEQLIGAAAGSTVEVHVLLPEDYGTEDMRGKEAVFTVTVNGIQNETVPAYDTAFILSQGYETKEAYELYIREALKTDVKAYNDSQIKSTLWDYVINNTQVKKYPKDELKAFEEAYQLYIEDYLEYYHISMEEYLAKMELTQEEWDAQMKEFCENTILNRMVVLDIARKEGLTLTDEEYGNGMITRCQAEGYESLEAFFTKNGYTYEDSVGRENLVITMTSEKVLDFLLEHSASGVEE